MASVLNIAVSGLQAASRRLSVSANNIANVGVSRPAIPEAAISEPGASDRAAPTTGFAPQRALDESLISGGVRTVVSPVEPGAVIVSDNSSETGFSSFPNINFFAEYLEQKQALVAYKANASVIRAQQELDKSLLDIET
jgi:flagellar basal-body rod protein FlgC